MFSGLKRYPERGEKTLQAWDAADELILEHLSGIDHKGRKILIVNDTFGALSAALEDNGVSAYTDSYLSYKAIGLNTHGKIRIHTQLCDLEGPYDFVVMRVPKNMSFFEDILCRLSRHLQPHTKLICGYMIKHQADASFELLNRIIGQTTTSLARKKARLIFASYERTPTPSPYPLEVRIATFAKPFTNHSNVFSREKLDIGTRYLLEHLPKGTYPRVLDLGCGNGIIGIALQKLNPKSHLVFCDESQMAIESAKANYASYFPALAAHAEFHWTHSFEGQAAESVDLVVCNPPFHQGNAIGDFTAREMFQDAHRCLAKGGLLRVIGNTHLPYPQMLKQIFGNAQRVASGPKFAITDSVK